MNEGQEVLDLTAREIASGFIDYGWAPIPIPSKTKSPVFEGWQNLRITHGTVDQFFNGAPLNIGVLLGDPSNGLVDGDLDCAEAIRLAAHFLPLTLMFGREGKRNSHRLYKSRQAHTRQFHDIGDEKNSGSMLVELRATGVQTIFPGSIHPTGEPIFFENECSPIEIDFDDLKDRMTRLAVASLLARHGLSDDEAIALAHEWDQEAESRLPLGVVRRARRWLSLTPIVRHDQPTLTIDLETRISRARRYVEKMPPSISGQGGHQAAWSVAITLCRGFDLPIESARIVFDEFNSRCEPPWSDSEIRHKLENALDARIESAYLLRENKNAQIEPAITTQITTPISEFLGDEADCNTPDEFLIAGQLPSNVVAFLAGLPKCGKTWIAIQSAMSVALGRPLFGKFACKQGSVVIVTEEDTVKQIRRRIFWLAHGLGIDPRDLPMRVSALKSFRIDDEAQLRTLEQEASGASLIVLDALTRIHGLDENDRTAMQAVTLALSRLTARTGATTLVIHHMRKRAPTGDSERAGQRMRGTGDLHALARAIISVEKRDDGAIELSGESNYGGDVEPYAVKLHIDPPPIISLKPGEQRRAWFDYLGGAEQVTQELIDKHLLARLAEVKRPQSKTEIRALLGGNARAVDDAIKRQDSAGRIELVPAEKPNINGQTIKFKGWQLVRGAS